MLHHLAGTSDDGLLMIGAAFPDATIVGRLNADGSTRWGRSIAVRSDAGTMAAEIALSQTTAYLLAVDGARNLERAIDGIVLARLDEHGDVGTDGCGLMSRISLRASGGSTIQAQTGPLNFVNATPEVNAITSTVTDRTTSGTMICRHERQPRLDPPFLIPRVTICVDDPREGPFPLPSPRPSGSIGLAPRLATRTCHDDPGCLRCLQRLDDGASLRNPEWRADLYRTFRPFAQLPEHHIAVDAIDELRAALAKVPTGRLFTDKVSNALRDRSTRWKRIRAKKGNAYVPREVAIAPYLAHAANLIDLDLVMPGPPPLQTTDDGVTVGPLVRLRQDPGLLRGTRVRLVGDVPGPLPPRVATGWPTPVWRIQLGDDSLDYLIELSYRGLRWSASDADLLLVQWQGDSVRDATLRVDRDRQVVIGRAVGSGTFTILQAVGRRRRPAM
jgi:hypothetical protein